MIKEDDIAWTAEQLRKKFDELGRFPKKEDFDEKTRSRIKAYLGPWPRALERAGIKKETEAHKQKILKKAKK